MGNVDWYEQVKENFSSVIARCSKGALLEMYKDRVFTVDFIEYEGKRTIEIKLAEQKKLIGVLKYSEAGTYFYMDYHVIPPLNRRIIMDTAELLTENIEKLIIRGIYNSAMGSADNIVPVQKIQ